MRINKLIFYTIFEIILLLLFIPSTYIFWNSLNLESKDIAYSYINGLSEIDLNLENNLVPLLPIKDKELSKDNKLIINLNNNSKVKKQYYIYLKINGNTNIDTKYLKVLLNNEPRYLYTLENFTRNGNKYYLINHGVIKSKQKINEDFFIWLSEETPNTEQNKSLNFDITVEEV